VEDVLIAHFFEEQVVIRRGEPVRGFLVILRIHALASDRPNGITYLYILQSKTPPLQLQAVEPKPVICSGILCGQISLNFKLWRR